jgi:hypothetical protein
MNYDKEQRIRRLWGAAMLTLAALFILLNHIQF